MQCAENSGCHNSNGSYNCTCWPGYSGQPCCAAPCVLCCAMLGSSAALYLSAALICCAVLLYCVPLLCWSAVPCSIAVLSHVPLLCCATFLCCAVLLYHVSFLCCTWTCPTVLANPARCTALVSNMQLVQAMAALHVKKQPSCQP